ncbi:MAG TPA: PAS domain S-box protein [Epulopiscium sp.]|nr:PAS domain S-box protein [Candidatus Epulonipiscium sp.]
MKEHPKFEFIIHSVLLVIGVLLGVVLFYIHTYISDGIAILMIIGDVFLVLAFSFISWWKYKKNVYGQIDALMKNIESISKGEEADFTPSKAFEKVYNALESLRGHLKRQNRIKVKTFNIINALAVNIQLEKLLEDLLPKVIDATRSNWGAFYIASSVTNKLEIKASFGFSKNVYKEFDISIGEGFIGQAAQSNEIQIISDIPEDTAYCTRTFLGKIKPKSLMVVPISTQHELVGILVLASITDYQEEQIEVIKSIRYYLGMSVSNAMIYERTERLSKELQFQNQLIQNMNDELEEKVKERTDFLNNIINSIKDYAIVSMDKDGFITTWNKGAELLEGYKAEEIIGNHISTLYKDEDVKSGKVEKELEIAKTEGEYVEYGWRIKKNGENYFAEVLITPMYNKNNELIGFTNITKDITAMKNMEQALIYEKNFNQKLLESSTRALLLIDREGIIIQSNELISSLLGFTREEMKGKYFADYFDDPEMVDKSLKDMMRRGSLGEWKWNIRDKENNSLPVIVNAYEIMDHQGKGSEILLYLKIQEI